MIKRVFDPKTIQDRKTVSWETLFDKYGIFYKNQPLFKVFSDFLELKEINRFNNNYIVEINEWKFRGIAMEIGKNNFADLDALNIITNDYASGFNGGDKGFQKYTSDLFDKYKLMVLLGYKNENKEDFLFQKFESMSKDKIKEILIDTISAFGFSAYDKIKKIEKFKDITNNLFEEYIILSFLETDVRKKTKLKEVISGVILNNMPLDFEFLQEKIKSKDCLLGSAGELIKIMDLEKIKMSPPPTFKYKGNGLFPFSELVKVEKVKNLLKKIKKDNVNKSNENIIDLLIKREKLKINEAWVCEYLMAENKKIMKGKPELETLLNKLLLKNILANKESGQIEKIKAKI